MKFSIILTIDKNKNKDTLEKCLNSILKQTYKDFEIILLTDDSSIDINQICKKYSEQYSDKIIYLIQKSFEAFALKNLGIKYSTGDYILFSDEVDYYKSYALKKIYEKIITQKQLGRIEENNTFTSIGRIVFDTVYELPEMVKFSSNLVGSKKNYLTGSGQNYLLQCLNQNESFDNLSEYCFNKKFLLKNNLLFSLNTNESFIIKSLCFAKTCSILNDELLKNQKKISINSNKTDIESKIMTAKELNTFLLTNSVSKELELNFKKQIFYTYYNNAFYFLEEDIVLKNKYLLKNMTTFNDFLKSIHLLIQLYTINLWEKHKPT